MGLQCRARGPAKIRPNRTHKALYIGIGLPNAVLFATRKLTGEILEDLLAGTLAAVVEPTLDMSHMDLVRGFFGFHGDPRSGKNLWRPKTPSGQITVEK